jgi:hypothetical protein
MSAFLTAVSHFVGITGGRVPHVVFHYRWEDDKPFPLRYLFILLNKVLNIIYINF